MTRIKTIQWTVLANRPAGAKAKPFGETLVDEHLNSYNTPFKFNGKELDDEIEERRFADSIKISI